MPLTFEKALSLLDRRDFFGIRLGLDRTFRLMGSLGNPQNGINFIHIAGSNGKGSTGSFMASSLKEAGFKTGFYTSPHLVSVRERFRINGTAISREAFARIMEKILPALEKMDQENDGPTYFELATAIAIMFFKEEKVDFAVWETGLGGRLDATNIVDPVCSVITGISLEHTDRLGKTIELIALEKAGIIKKGKPVFCGAGMDDNAKRVFSEKCSEMQCDLSFADSSFKIENLAPDSSGCYSFNIGGDFLKLSLAGYFQVKNALLAYSVLKFLSEKYEFKLSCALKGFSSAKWPGRLQKLPGGGIMDGAHNPEGIENMVAFVKKFYPGERFTVFFGNLADKDTAECLRMLSEIASEFIFVPVEASRTSRTPEELERMLSEIAPGIPCKKYPSPLDAVNATRKTSKLLITGSLYMLGEIMPVFFTENEITDI